MTIDSLVRESCRAPLLPASERQRGPCLDGAAVATLLAQRGSSLFVDRITHIQSESKLLGISSDGASVGEPAGIIVCRCDLGSRAPFFAGHSPGAPLWPAVLQFEAIGQAGTCLYRLLETDRSRSAGREFEPAPANGGRTEALACVVTDILAGRCLRPVVPEGDVEIVARIYRDGLFVVVVGQCLKDGAVCSAAALRGIELEDLA